MASNQKRRILVIEDDEDIKTVMVAYLKRAGNETIAASDGKDGLKPAGGGRRFRVGFGGRGGFSGSPIGIVTGSVSQVDGNQITVDTESVGVTANLLLDTTVQIYKTGTIDDLTDGLSVLVVTSTDDESGAPVTTTSVVINPPEFGRQFGGGGGGIGGRPPRPWNGPPNYVIRV
jgi:CheY-like chemotaxis protein